MSTPKPIIIVRITSIGKMSDDIDRMDYVQKKLDKKFDDYHVLVMKLPHNVHEPTVEVFYEKDFNEVKYEELKEMVRQEIKET